MHLYRCTFERSFNDTKFVRLSAGLIIISSKLTPLMDDAISTDYELTNIFTRCFVYTQLNEKGKLLFFLSQNRCLDSKYIFV